ncbi:MAG: Gfo/Idh/MocA family protein [Oscillospiraceae bacterium]
MTPIRVGILGAGTIAHTMATTLAQMTEATAYAVASRNIENAAAFAKPFGIEKVYGSYLDMVKDPDVDLIYIATPHSHHYEHAKLCLTNDKPVLCEKAFTANTEQAEELFEIAKRHGIFASEGMWTRFTPMAQHLQKLLAEGVIGEPRMLTCDFGENLVHVERLVNPALAGGALLDLGVYAINFASIAFGSDVQSVTSAASLTDSGVDAQESISLQYADGRIANLSVTMQCPTGQHGIIYGTKGWISVEGLTNYKRFTVFNKEHGQSEVYDRPAQITGFEYEVLACVEALREKRLECPEMPHAETLRIMRLMDSLRAHWGERFPFE